MYAFPQPDVAEVVPFSAVRRRRSPRDVEEVGVVTGPASAWPRPRRPAAHPSARARVG